MDVLKSSLGDHILIYKIHKDEIARLDFVHLNEPTETLESYYKRVVTKPQLLFNGGFFHLEDGKTVFNFIDERVSITDVSEYTRGIGVTTDGKMFFDDIRRLRLDNPDYFARVRDFVSGYPVLIQNYNPTHIDYASEINYKARRTVLGISPTHVFAIFVNDPGADFSILQTICLEFDIEYAINLDGGSSTRCLLDGVLQTKSQSWWSRPVDNAVALYLKPQNEKVKIYRVQVGAWRTKSLADHFLESVRLIPDEVGAGYADSYVRYIDGWYKIQVGAFSRKEGAQKVYDDLISKNFKTFIV